MQQNILGVGEFTSVTLSCVEWYTGKTVCCSSDRGGLRTRRFRLKSSFCHKVHWGTFFYSDTLSLPNRDVVRIGQEGVISSEVLGEPVTAPHAALGRR